MAMIEHLQSFIATCKERASSVFTGSFMLAWLICNIEPVTIFLTWDMNIVTKWKYISSHYTGFDHLILYPFFLSTIHTILVPGINLCIEYVQSAVGIKVFEIKSYRETRSIKATEQTILAKIELEKAEEAARNINTHKEQVESLQGALSSATGHIENLKKDLLSKQTEHEEELRQLKNSYEETLKNRKDIEVSLVNEKDAIISKQVEDLQKIKEYAARLEREVKLSVQTNPKMITFSIFNFLDSAKFKVDNDNDLENVTSMTKNHLLSTAISVDNDTIRKNVFDYYKQKKQE